MRWSKMKALKDAPFKRLTGVSKTTFGTMAHYLQEQRGLSKHRVAGGKRGPKPRLCAQDELLMMLMYYREYRSFMHIGTTYDLGEVQARRIILRIEEQLAASKLFALPGKKKLLEGENHFEIVVVDVSEHPIERPKKSSGDITRARKRGIP